MLRKIIKRFMVIAIVSGVAFSTFIYFSSSLDANLRAGGSRGTNVYQNGHWICDGIGDDCDK